MSNHKLQPVRGTKDLFGEEIKIFNEIVKIAKNKSAAYGFEELQTPIFEFSEVFERNLGEASDIVSKEVYKFPDRGDNFLTLRPEFTASIVRSFISNGEFQQVLPRKFFSCGPLFRYERPQKGRQRQFNQVNFEVFGQDSFYLDVEIILLANSLLKDLGVINEVNLEINSLGCAQTKIKYEEELKKYFTKYKNDLSEDSKVRLEKNPLRILDSKSPQDIKLLETVPAINDFYSMEAKSRFESILNQLEKFNISYKINQKLVRGLDYYTSTVFEFVTSHEGAQNTALAGGRYDSLVEKMSGKHVPAIGFAAGIERLMLISQIKTQEIRPVVVVYVSDEQKNAAFELVQKLRNNNIATEFVFDANFKKQMKKSSQFNARFVVILGEEEIKNSQVVVKDFDNAREQTVKEDLLVHYLEGKC